MEKKKPLFDTTISLGSIMVVLTLSVDLGINLQRLKAVERAQTEMKTELSALEEANNGAHLEITRTLQRTATMIDQHLLRP